MRRVAALSLVLLLALPAFAGCTVLSKQDTWDLEVTVGVLVAASDGYPLTDVGDAVEIAARQMDGAGFGLEMKIVREDNVRDPAAAFDRLAQRGAAAIVAAVAPDDAQALVARASALKRPLLLATPSAAPLSGDVSYTIQVAQDPRAVGAALAALAAREGATAPILFHAGDPFVALVATGFTTAWNGTAPSELVHRVSVQSDVTAQARAACSLSGDALIVLSRADETGWAARALTDAGCRDRVRVLAAPSGRGPALVAEAGEDPSNRPLAAGVLGIEPLRTRADAFRALFEAELGRVPHPYANEGYDAAIYIVLAAFAAEGNVDAEPQKATITAAQLQRKLLDVASAPGIQHQDLAAAIEAAQAADDLDWPGFAHDDAFTARRQPASAAFNLWRVGQNGGFERAGSLSL